MPLIVRAFSVDAILRLPGRSTNAYQLHPVMEYQDAEMALKEGDRLLKEEHRPNVIRQVIKHNIGDYHKIPTVEPEQEEYIFLQTMSPDRGKYRIMSIVKASFPETLEKAKTMFVGGRDLAIAKIVDRFEREYDPR